MVCHKYTASPAGKSGRQGENSFADFSLRMPRAPFRFLEHLMSKTYEDSTVEEAADFLYPLTSRHTRTDAVMAEMTALSRLPIRQVVARARETAPDQRLARETLVAVVRGFLRAGHQKAADEVLTILIDRLRPAVEARGRRWSALFPADADNAEGDAVLTLIAHIRSTEAGQEFWECNFVFCFHKRLDDAFLRAARQRRDVSSLTSERADGTERDRAEEAADPQGEAAFDDIETQELIEALNRQVPGFAEYYFLHQNGYTDKEIAPKLGVADRTLRNWKDRAKTILPTLRPQP